MAKLLKGKDVATSINNISILKVKELNNKNIFPCLATLRVGDNKDDISYEKNATKKCYEIGVKVINIVLEENVSENIFYNKIEELNNDNTIHGILLFRPLPKHLDSNKARLMINHNKDVDGSGDDSLGGVFTNSKKGFNPCTAEAALEILKYYNIELTGKNVVVMGRSLVVGKPLSMLLLNENATVTICHTKTKNIEKITSCADILICATGQMESINKNYVNNNQTIIDIGITWNDVKQKLCGDCLFEEIEPIVENITPVPRGVGAVTTSVLIKHVIEAAERTIHE